MFGPNAFPRHSHRSDWFHRFFEETIDCFKSSFGLPSDSIVLLITGSGTLANEIVLSSLLVPLHVRTEGSFSDRLRMTKALYATGANTAPVDGGVCYETGVSQKHDCRGMAFVDCVSSFPYYPAEGQVWTTVSSKQLGGATGLSLIVLQDIQTLENMFYSATPSYLSLQRYYDKSLLFETPNTPCIDTMAQFRAAIEDFDILRHRNKIDSRRQQVLRWLAHYEIEPIGDGPVVTIPNGVLPLELVKRYGIYTNSGTPQIFLWAGPDNAYDQLTQERIR